MVSTYDPTLIKMLFHYDVICKMSNFTETTQEQHNNLSLVSIIGQFPLVLNCMNTQPTVKWREISMSPMHL